MKGYFTDTAKVVVRKGSRVVAQGFAKKKSETGREVCYENSKRLSRRIGKLGKGFYTIEIGVRDMARVCSAKYPNIPTEHRLAYD